MASISARDARRVAIAAQGLLGPRPVGGTAVLLQRLRAVQLDTISVLARSHELVAYARLGAVPRASVERALWGEGAETFEYWAHASCVVPLETWPLYAAKRRRILAKGKRWHVLEDKASSAAYVRSRLLDDGPLTARQLGGAKRGGSWWEWSEVKIAAEWLLDIGEVVCRTRQGFERVYDLAERAVPGALRARALDDEACARGLVSAAARALGVATVADMAAFCGMLQAPVRTVVDGLGLVPCDVEGWGKPAYAAPGALEVLDARLRRRTVLLSPFDSLLWDRPRMERLFSMTYRFEAYVPAHLRVNGYFSMPLLAGDRIVALVDPKRTKDTLCARHVVLRTKDAPRHVAAALAEAATWVGCTEVEVDRVTPASRTAEVRGAL